MHGVASPGRARRGWMEGLPLTGTLATSLTAHEVAVTTGRSASGLTRQEMSRAEDLAYGLSLWS